MQSNERELKNSQQSSIEETVRDVRREVSVFRLAVPRGIHIERGGVLARSCITLRSSSEPRGWGSSVRSSQPFDFPTEGGWGGTRGVRGGWVLRGQSLGRGSVNSYFTSCFSFLYKK